MRRMAIGTAAVLALGAGLALAAPKKAPAKPAEEKATSGEKLPAAARELLVAKMRNHRVDTNLLMRAVILLDRPDIVRLAERIATESQLARPLPNEPDQLNSLVPPRFFELQDRMQQESRAIAAAAKSKDDVELGRAFGRVVESCVACHAAYLDPGTAGKSQGP